MRRFTDDDLRRIYRGVSAARPAGTFSGRHGPLEATAWVHVVLADMERLDDALIEAVHGDHDALDAAASLARYEQPMAEPCGSALLDDDELGRATVGIADPVALAVTVHFLIAGGHADEGRRLLSFAVRRTAALNVALIATDRYAAGWWSGRRFARLVRNVNPLEAGADHHAAGGEHEVVEGRTHRVEHAHADTSTRHAAPAGREGSRGSGCCVDHEPLTDALQRRWQQLVDVVRDEATTSMLPASGDVSLYERVLDRVDARAGRRPRARSVASSLTAVPAQREVPTSGVPEPLLTLTPVTATVVVGEPVHVWVRLVGAASDTAVVVESSRGARVAVTVKPAEAEALATLPPVREAGSFDLRAAVADRGLTSASTRIEAAHRRPYCPPQQGGSWDVASVQAHDVPDRCKPAKAVGDAAARLRGHAGALLTGAYNSAVVGSQLCVRKANTKVCARTREDNVRNCTQERDQGYNRCAEQRDQGYRRCCDWAPCRWFCRAWVWVSNVVCVVWEWVSNVVCVAWEWVKNIVCVAWRVVVAAACVIAAIVVGVVKAVVGIVALLAGVVTAIIGNALAGLCALFKVRPSEEVSDTLKVVAIHMALLPTTGRVLLMGYDEGVYPVDADHPADFTAVADSDRGLCAVWDPATGKARYTRDLRRNLFCAHHAFLPDGRLLVASGQFPLPGLLKDLIPPRLLAPGADADLHVFDPRTEKWQRLPNMQHGRWYPTCVTLPDGRVFITSGTNGWATSPGLGRGIQNTWECADGTGPLGGSQKTHFYWFHLYPFQHVLGDGRVFTHSKRTTRLFNPATGKWCRAAPGGALTAPPGQTPEPGETVWPYSRTGPGPGTSVLLPLVPTRDGERWAYPAGRVMILGGGGAEGAPEPEIEGETYDLHADTPATRTAEVLDLSQDRDQVAWRATQPMSNGRVMPDSVLLPDGTVLVIGGGRYGRSGGLLAHFATVEQGGAADKGALDPILEPELFDPATETWRSLCRKPIGRLYHTTAMLLADGRVVVGGHDGALNMQPYDRSRYELEVFSPPYLFAADGSPAPRPVVSRAPERVAYGQPLTVVVNRPIRSAALIRPSAVTHQTNAEQRYVELGVVNADRSGGETVLAAPPDANVAPPGWYLLFVIDAAGTPSVGHWMQLSGG